MAKEPVGSRRRKSLIVCAKREAELENQLVRDGWAVVWAHDSKTALAKVQRDWIDAAVLISTDGEMDITETLLNLRDMRPAMPIVVAKEFNAAGEHKESDSFPVPNTTVSSINNVAAQLKSVMDHFKEGK